MDRRTTLKATSCDLKRLPLGAREAFFLSQLDGQLTLEEIAEISGIALDEALRLAKVLVDLGAVTAQGGQGGQAGQGGAGSGEVRSPRVDPRAEPVSIRPASRSLRPDARSAAKRTSLRPARPSKQVAAGSERRRSRKSVQAQRAVTPSPAPAAARKDDGPSDLDEAVLAAIATLDAKIGALDHYAVLELERDADRKSVKRAYFALAGKYHPDRFFGKKLGSARAPIERIFRRITDAHDTLADVARRAEYDAALPPATAPPRVPKKSIAPTPTARPSKKPEPARRKSSRAIRAVSRKMKQVEVAAPAPEPPQITGVRRKYEVPEAANPERARQLKNAAMEIAVQANVERLLKAAEDALKNEDVTNAANHYRLALSHREDPYLRRKYEEIDARARIVKFEKNVGAARAAEREKRWADAAVYLSRAHEARPDADVAARAANALLLAGGDLDRATGLAEQAIALEPRSVAHRVTLGEVHLAAKRLSRAEEIAAEALALAPKDARLKELTAAIAEAAKAKRKKD